MCKGKRESYKHFATSILLILMITFFIVMSGCGKRIPKTEAQQEAKQGEQPQVREETGKAEVTGGIEPALEEIKSAENDLDINQLEKADINPEDIDW